MCIKTFLRPRVFYVQNDVVPLPRPRLLLLRPHVCFWPADLEQAVPADLEQAVPVDLEQAVPADLDLEHAADFEDHVRVP